jgi:hypothetical protein
MQRRQGFTFRGFTAALVTVAALMITAGSARAEPRDPCEDLRNQQRVHETLASEFLDFAQLLLGAGAPTLYLQFHEQYEVERSLAQNVERNLIRLGCG